MIILGLGSNYGDREEYLQQAVDMLDRDVLAAIDVSAVYESKAVLKQGSPANWSDMSYLNMAVMGESHLLPSDLLKKIKMIENQIGRQYRGTWAPREIDIDILAYADLCVENDELIIPHKYLLQRSFAMLPLCDLAPNWQCPEKGKFQDLTAFDICNQLFSDNDDIIKTDILITPQNSFKKTKETSA